MFAIPFSVYINTQLAHFQTECIELQSDTQLKSLIMSLHQAFNALSYQRKTSLASQSHLIHVITFWQYIHL